MQLVLVHLCYHQEWDLYIEALAGAGFNTLGQIAADETPIEDIDDLNLLSLALSGGLGALGSRSKVSGAMRGGIDNGVTAVMQFGRMQ